jgi:hypothetical protein
MCLKKQDIQDSLRNSLYIFVYNLYNAKIKQVNFEVMYMLVPEEAEHLELTLEFTICKNKKLNLGDIYPCA